MTSRPRQVRASGETAAVEEAQKSSGELDYGPAAEIVGEEREIKFRTPGFARIRTDWSGDDALIVQRVRMAVDDRLVHNFSDAFSILHELYEVVRTPEHNADGEVMRDRFGFTMWARTPSGSYEEDWTRLGGKERENYLFQITTRIFEWSQRATDVWTEAMLAKAQYEERFSMAYDAPQVGTIEDRTAVAKIDAADERYFAIFLAAYSRKADSLVRSLELIGQRLKDAMTA